MFKKISLAVMALVFGMSSCSEESCDHEPGGSGELSTSLVGSWYEEALNEEMRFSESGKLYDRYANYSRCGETEGSWEFNSKTNKLTYSYPFMGDMNYIDWTVKDLTENSFTLSSSKDGMHKVERIVEEYTLNVGETVEIKYGGLGTWIYVSQNERIASVNPRSGVIKAEGEKGITYIKVLNTATTNDNNASKKAVWVKVTVGDNCADLWYDYVGLIGLDYASVTKALSSLGTPAAGTDGYSFAYGHTKHDVADFTNVFLCPEDNLTNEIQLVLKKSVPESAVLSYMNSHYYKMKGDDSYVYFSSSSDPETSKAIVVYNKQQRNIVFCETQHFFQKAHVKELWEDFVPLFGANQTAVKKAMGDYGYKFLKSDASYSKDGSDYYTVSGNKYITMVGFVFNPDKQVSEFWLYMDTTSDANEVYKYLLAKYKEEKTESSKTSLVFYNDDKTMKVVFDLKNGTLTYTKLSMKQHETPKKEMLGTYYEALGMSHDQIVSKYGAPYQEDGTSMYYVVGSENVSIVSFTLDSNTGKCKNTILLLTEQTTLSTVVDYFNSKYYKFDKGTTADGSQYAWVNKSTFATSTMEITYFPKDRMVIYVPINAATSSSSNGVASLMKRDSTSFAKLRSKAKAIVRGAKKVK